MTSSELPGQAEQPAEITCPLCGQFVGALTRCPRCGARVEKRMSVRVFRYAAVLLGTMGLALLYAMVKHREIPIVKVGEIKPTMNFAYVRIAGRVVSEPRVYKEEGRVRRLNFIVDDGSGEISIIAFGGQAAALVQQRKVPAAGDYVEIAGSLAPGPDDSVTMRVQLPDHVVVKRADIPVTPLGEITSALVGRSVMIEGSIVSVNPPAPGTRMPWVISVQDESGSGQITFWQDVYPDIRDKALLTPGVKVRARVSVQVYRDRLQLRLIRGEDLEIQTGDRAELLIAGPGVPIRADRTVEIADLDAQMKGREVTVYGRVVEVAPPTQPRGPHTMVLEDEGHRVTVKYWDNVAQHLGDHTPRPGVLMKVRGWVDAFQGRVELRVTHSDRIRLVDILPRSEDHLESEGLVKVADLSEDRVGRNYTVEGVLGEPRSLMKGVIYPLKDNTGELELVLWDRFVPGEQRDSLQPGQRVRVTGRLAQYQGTLQLVPANARGIELR